MDTKAWWKSVSVWGNIIAMIATAGGFFGYVVTPENQAAGAALLGECVGLWGRLRASTRLN